MSDVTKCPKCAFPLQELDGICPRCGQSYCSDCGAILAEDADVCSVCGAEFLTYCSECDQEIPSTASVCPHCGAALDEADAEADSDVALKPVYLILPARYSGKCPVCDSSVFLEDGFCSQCGALFCSTCGGAVGDEDEKCPHCQTPLYFDCPLCGFELMTGTDQCPNCNALIPNFCTICKAALPPDTQQCANCSAQVHVVVRNSARIVHSLQVGEQIVQVAACPGCGAKLYVNEGVCKSCGYRICPACQITLLPDELICPRCGPENAQIVYTQDRSRKCPNCGQPLDPLAEECPHCELLFCPECHAPIGEEDVVCASCGTEFEFECPECGETVGAQDNVCSSCGAEI
jgi:predicted amidophosphoribosyltransferase